MLASNLSSFLDSSLLGTPLHHILTKRQGQKEKETEIVKETDSNQCSCNQHGRTNNNCNASKQSSSFDFSSYGTPLHHLLTRRPGQIWTRQGQRYIYIYMCRERDSLRKKETEIVIDTEIQIATKATTQRLCNQHGRTNNNCNASKQSFSLFFMFLCMARHCTTEEERNRDSDRDGNTRNNQRNHVTLLQSTWLGKQPLQC